MPNRSWGRALHHLTRKDLCSSCRKQFPVDRLQPDPSQDPDSIAAITHPRYVCSACVPMVSPPPRPDTRPRFTRPVR